MKASLFEPMVFAWCDEVAWSKDELRQATQLLLELSKANAGAVAPDAELDAATSNEFALRRADEVLARRVATYASTLRDKFMRPRFSAPREEQRPHVLESLVASEWNDCIDINHDDADALCRLPGITPATALQIIDHRSSRGRFSELGQLTSIEGIDAAVLEGMRVRAFCGPSERISAMTDDLARFVRRPTFQNYVSWIAGSQEAFALSISQNEDPKTQVLAELNEALADARGHRYGVARNLGFTRASGVLAERKRSEDAERITANASQETECGALLFDGQYLPFLADLVEQAERSIHVVMFFMKYEEGTDYVVNSLVESLIRASKKGLDVRVILDKDASDGVARSRLINEPAFQVLKKNSVPVVYDSEARMTHSKLVVVDGKHVVVGSHNWTGGSFLAYDDTSIYVESAELGQKYQDMFGALWAEFNAPTTTST